MGLLTPFLVGTRTRAAPLRACGSGTGQAGPTRRPHLSLSALIQSNPAPGQASAGAARLNRSRPRGQRRQRRRPHPARHQVRRPVQPRGAALGAAYGTAHGAGPGTAYGAAPAPGAAHGTGPEVTPWQSGPGGTYAPDPPQPAKKSHIALIITATLAAVVLVVGGLVALGLPAYDRVTGHTWFNGGVPGWSPIRVTNFPSGGATLLQAWRVPGPTVGPSKPFLQVAKLKEAPTAGETATQYLAGTLQYLSTHGPGSGGLVTINDGAPGLEWTRPTPLANDPGLGITSFWLYAEKGGTAYWIAFQTDSQHYATELPGVEAVMLNFKATGQ